MTHMRQYPRPRPPAPFDLLEDLINGAQENLYRLVNRTLTMLFLRLFERLFGRFFKKNSKSKH